MPSIVALDIETTGLDLQKDAITEIGAVRFNGNRVEDEWTTLVNPNRPIPTMITNLTGISNEMVRNARPLNPIIHELADFVGNAPVLGHSVRFDLSFLQRSNILLDNEFLDTYELASVLMPTASRYNLGGLASQLGILLPATHRALDDARCTHALYTHLYEKALELPVELIAEFVRLSEPFDWGANWLFSHILRDRWQQPLKSKSDGHSSHASTFNFPSVALQPPLKPVETPVPLDPDEIAALLEYGGPFFSFFFRLRTAPSAS